MTQIIAREYWPLSRRCESGKLISVLELPSKLCYPNMGGDFSFVCPVSGLELPSKLCYPAGKATTMSIPDVSVLELPSRLCYDNRRLAVRLGSDRPRFRATE